MGSSLREGDSNQLAVHRWEEPGPTDPGSSFSERFPPDFYVRRVAATAHFSRSSRAAAISLSRRRIRPRTSSTRHGSGSQRWKRSFGGPKGIVNRPR